MRIILALSLIILSGLPVAAQPLSDAEDKIVGDCHYEFGPRTKAAEQCVVRRVAAMNRMIDRRDAGMTEAQTRVVLRCMADYRSINTSQWNQVERCYKRKTGAK